MTHNMGDRQRDNRRARGMVNAEEAAELLGKSRRTVCRWEREGKMPKSTHVWHRRLRLWLEVDIRQMATARAPE